MSTARRKLMAQIHIGKKQLGMDDDTYRSLLTGATGKDSCSKMDFNQLHQVVTAMKRRGFKASKPKATDKSPASRGPGRSTQVDKLRAIWITMGNQGVIHNASESALLHWVQNQLAKRDAKPIDSLNWLNGHPEINRLIEQLKRWQKRAQLNKEVAQCK